jgi:hypothetical protein
MRGMNSTTFLNESSCISPRPGAKHFPRGLPTAIVAGTRVGQLLSGLRGQNIDQRTTTGNRRDNHDRRPQSGHRSSRGRCLSRRRRGPERIPKELAIVKWDWARPRAS